MKAGTTTRIIKKSFIVFLGLLLFSTATARAEMMYVNDTLTITLRSGPGIEFRVISSLQTGDIVDLRETSGEWARIRLSDNREGWVLARYLSPQKPNYMLVESLAAQAESQKEKLGSLEKENSELTLENQNLSSTLERVEKNYASLKEGAEDYLDLKEEHQKMLIRLETLQTERDNLTAENNALKKAEHMQWFLIGFGVTMSVGLIGFILGRTRRRQKSDIGFSWK